MTDEAHETIRLSIACALGFALLAVVWFWPLRSIWWPTTCQEETVIEAEGKR